MTENNRDEYPDEAGYPDGAGFLSETQPELVDEVKAGAAPSTGIDFFIVDNEADKTFEAVSGDTLIGGITYRVQDDVVTLIHTYVYPEFQGQGVASELVRRVLDQIRSGGRTIVIECPVVKAFVEKHPEYQSLVSPPA
ncbi:GNAT family N-acetyltransferase [Leifsonia poae]|uniref:N-acetyltransferase n=1 Tax=Leifsonia poae TaxID=110933 RepID=A0A9W6HB63_9MICO|nr:GNAT family N-acetyltransferase [Leifsonia poae]GLJ77077.1 hypothetical protein GCM10017584_26510 [Leifsonia poae]